MGGAKAGESPMSYISAADSHLPVPHICTVTMSARGLASSLPCSWPAAVHTAVPVEKEFSPLPQALTSKEGNCEHWS